MYRARDFFFRNWLECYKSGNMCNHTIEQISNKNPIFVVKKTIR